MLFDGTGPFKMSEHKKDESATFNKNQHYWGERSKLNKVEAKVKPAGETAPSFVVPCLKSLGDTKT
jgi:nickel transport system substrate-binding protein